MPSSDATLLWMGFSHRWARTPHRFRDLETELTQFECRPQPDGLRWQIAGRLTGRQTVGVWHDRLKFWGQHKAIRTAAARFAHGAIGVQVEGKVGANRRSVHRFRDLALPLGALRGLEQHAVFMRGLGFVESSPLDEGAGAYPMRRIGMRFCNIRSDGDRMLVDLDVYLGITRKPDVAPPRPNPWVFKVHCPYTIAGGTDAEFAVTHHDQAFQRPIVDLDDPTYPRERARRRRATIEGRTPEDGGSWPHGVAVFRGFDIQLNHTVDGIQEGPGRKHLGRLVRGLDVRFKKQRYDAQTGELHLLPDIHYSNESAFYYPTNVRYQGFYSLLQFRDSSRWAESEILKDAGSGGPSGTTGKGGRYRYDRLLSPLIL